MRRQQLVILPPSVFHGCLTGSTQQFFLRLQTVAGDTREMGLLHFKTKRRVGRLHIEFAMPPSMQARRRAGLV